MDTIPISVADVAASVTVGLILWGIKSVSSGRKEIVSSVTALSQHVAETNGRLLKLESEMISHEKLDDERHADEKQDRQNIWEKLNSHIERRKG